MSHLVFIIEIYQISKNKTKHNASCFSNESQCLQPCGRHPSWVHFGHFGCKSTK